MSEPIGEGNASPLARYLLGVQPEEPHHGFVPLLESIAAGKRTFLERATTEPFACLVSPQDKLMIELEYFEMTGMTGFEDNSAVPNCYLGMVLQAAEFISRGKYLILGEEYYRHVLACVEVR